MSRSGILAVVITAALATACATGSGGPATRVAITSPAQLAGEWSGFVLTPTVSAPTVTVIRPDGSYSSTPRRPGLPTVNGTITVADGRARYQSVPGMASTFVTQSGTLELHDRAGQRVLYGRSDDGKVTFEARPLP